MKLHIAFYFVAAAAAQAIDVDWSTIDTMQIVPNYIAGLTDKGTGGRASKGSRITGGEEAAPGQFPYQVALLASTPRGTGFCGGSILNEEWVLTAAHCVDQDVESVELIIGAHNVVDGDSSQFRVPVEKIIVHEYWNRATATNDVALLKLPKPLTYSDRVQPIRLPTRSQINETFANQIAIVSGWGRYSDSATGISPVLRWTKNGIMPNGICRLFFLTAVVGSKICLAGDGGRSACNGDSGGPLVIVDSDGHLTLIGVVSYGIFFGCARGWPSVYSRVTSFLDWIEKNTHNSVVVWD